MPDWLNDDTLRVLEFLLKVAAVIGVGYTAWRILRRWLRPYMAGLIALTDLPQLTAGMGDMQRTVESMAQRLTRVHQEVLPNHGSSLRDAVGRTESTVSEVRRDLARVSGVVRARADGDEKRAMFESDASGRFIEVNRTYLRWVNRSASECLGWGWVLCIAPVDRSRVRAEWNASMQEQREFALDFQMIDSEGMRFPVQCLARPVQDAAGNVDLFVGTIRRLDEELPT